MKKFADWVIRLRIPILVGVVVFTAFSGYSLRNLKINSDILSYLPQDDPNVVLFNKVGEKFGGNSLAMVALEGEEVFSFEALTKIRMLTSAFEEVEGVTNVMSLTNILDIKKTEDGLEVGKLIDKRRIPQDKNELERLRAYTLSKDMYVGSLISADGRMTTILCRVRDEVNKDEVGRKIRDITEKERGNLKAYYAGVPLWMAFINDIISSDLVRLVPLVTLLVMLTLYVSFRTFRGVALPLATVMMSALWTVGLMPLFGVDFSLVSNGIPVLLIAIGSAYGIHMINKYNEDVRSGDSRLEGIRDALSEVGLPIVLAGVTTLIGFLSFLTSNLSLIREFGLFTALGVLFALIISVTFLPAALSFLKVKPPKVNHEGVEDTAITRFMDRLGAVILRREKLILIGAMVVVGVVVAGLPKIKREVNMVEYFKENNPIRVAEEVMEEKFGGAVPVQIYVRGEIKNPFVLKKMRMIERYMATVPNVNDPQSIADLICEINEVMNGRYEIPDTEAGVGNLWFFLEGNEVLDQLITPDHKEAVIQAKLGTIDTKKITDVVNRLEHYLNAQSDTAFVVVNLAEVSHDFRIELKKARLCRIRNNILLDVERRHGLEAGDRAKLGQILDDALRRIPEEPDEAARAHILNTVAEMLQEEEEDVVVDRRTAMRIKDDLTLAFSRNALSVSDVENILKRRVDPAVIEEDPEALRYAAKSILALIEDGWSEIKVAGTIQRVKKNLPGRMRKDERLHKDLKANLWEINEDHVAVPYETYRKLGGEDDPEIVRISLQQTGLPPIYRELDRQLLRSQIQSLALALILVFILLTVQLRSLTGGLISIVPIVFTVLVNFGVMAYFHIPLDDATMMISAVAVGIGIDYTIHFISRFKVEFGSGKSELEALDKTLETAGKAIVINAASVMMGFLVLVLSNLVPMQRFGWLTALTMVTSAVGAITLLPALILITKAKFMGNWSLNGLVETMREKAIGGVKRS